ncbi:CHAP domain-containing protein [Solirubrobacter sp. CPCC 204708]|uniref:CHAP domain-containing protein n=1 Tax=Solirubrobacter deserti TaxID=2282478 RepID=A0ABT4RI34_9ACTN|nr:CHAP domain-containing protein [Solirubrobacter deserti]MBE2318830.1 CHAP domain-containing protein [Solirubrobacter deserti]MDA0138210.1 CHAP domain-containing protein [Solirubrobacter deserti]
MTRISIEPSSVLRAASALRDVAGEHRRSASRLASDGLPSMPPDLVGRYAGRIRALAADLDALAGELVRAGSNLDKRARLAEASQAGASTTTVVPIPIPPPEPPLRTPRIPSVRMPQSGGRAAHLANALGASGGAPPSHPAGAASQQDAACWLAAQSRSAGAPGELLVMAALTESGGQNLSYGDRDSVGYFQIRPSTNFAPAGFGVPPETKVSGDWWVQNPDAQAAWARDKIAETAGGERDADLSDPVALGAWAQAIERSAYPDRYAQHYDQARELVKHCSAQEPSRGGGDALRIAARELGVRESGDNTGARVSVFQDATGAYNAPWCASFVTWALEESGRSMPDGNWAAVASWVAAAQAGTAGLELVSAAEARPGDLVAYDWGFGSDFGQDGHIGMLATDVSGGTFEAIEGNYQDAVTHTSRSVDDANVVFIRVS